MNVFTVDFSNQNRLDKKYSAIYERLKSIAKKYYDAELTYKAFATQQSENDKTLINLLKKNNPLVLPERILYPIDINKDIVGFCELKTEKNLNKLEQVRLKHLIELLLTHSLKSSKRLSQLRAKEQLLFNKSTAPTKSDKNVIHLHQFKKTETSNVDFYEKPTPPLKLNVSIFVNGSDSDDNFKMARELHDFSDRFAFIQWTDLDLQSVKKDGIENLGPVTIYIPEILQLDAQSIELIKNYYKSARRDKASSPQFISASNKSIQCLTKNNLFNKELLIYFTAVHLTLDHDFNHYRKSGIIDFVFESMTKARS